MRKSGGLTVALAIGTLAFAAEVGGQEKETTVADVGRKVFEQYCASCHGVDGKGGGEFATYLKTPPPDLTQIAKRHGGTFPETKLADWIDGREPFPGHGTREMPIWGQRFGSMVGETTGKQASIRQESILLIAYLRSIQQK
ncbi:MAG TPA: c-type cytochrome [Myxococcota bacterium]|nr:c-type cytochrome [Myxococcota bacterium]